MGSQLDLIRRLNDAGWLCTERQDGHLKLRHADKPGELIVQAPDDADAGRGDDASPTAAGNFNP